MRCSRRTGFRAHVRVSYDTAMREVILPVPLVTQGPQPWCWAACSRMVIAYFRALKFTPSLTELVELGHQLPRGACEADEIPEIASGGNTIATMRVLMSYLGRRAVQRHRDHDPDVLVAAIHAGHPVILHVRSDHSLRVSHVVVARGVRQLPMPGGMSLELLINDPAREAPFWWPYGLLAGELIEFLVVRRDVAW